MVFIDGDCLEVLMDGFQHFCTDFRLCIGGLYADEELPYSQSGDVKYQWFLISDILYFMI